MDLSALLLHIYPFRFLRGTYRREVATLLSERSYNPGETIFRQYDHDQDVYLLAEGEVEVFDPHQVHDDVVLVVSANRFFGEWEGIFQEPRLYGARARQACRCYVLSGEQFRQVLQRSPTFAQGFGAILRDNQGIFAGFDRFKVQLLQQAGQGHVGIASLIPLYRALEPALHPGSTDPRRLDIPALLYAVRRLPENVTLTFAFLLVDELPEPFSDAERYLPAVPTAARRRDVWEILPGKDLVLLRSGDSDLIDLMSCLCLYAVEARKIRRRITRSGMVHRLDEFITNSAGIGTDTEEVRGFLNSLPFSSREVEGLMTIWPVNTARRISEITRHREMFSVEVLRQQRNSNARRGELWMDEVGRLAREVTGVDPADLPEEARIHIISSNTHSVPNCLNPWIPARGGEVERWARSVSHPYLEEQWQSPGDLVYALLPDFFSHHPDAAEAFRQSGSDAGQHRLDRTASTGIQVQFIDLTAIEGIAVDPCVTPWNGVSPARREYIVNIDYAFGEQAEYVIRNLLMLFGRNVGSVNFFGKAGALVGQRGDILAPAAFVEQHSDLFQPLTANGSGVERLRELLPGGTVHQGPLLTVDGTLLQNRRMLTFYRHIWDVIGIEMEGSHYYRGILESRQLGVIREDVPFRFFYYVSDLPLESHANLAAPLRRSEGVPPLYAITRHILNEISIGGIA